VEQKRKKQRQEERKKESDRRKQMNADGPHHRPEIKKNGLQRTHVTNRDMATDARTPEAETTSDHDIPARTTLEARRIQNFMRILAVRPDQGYVGSSTTAKAGTDIAEPQNRLSLSDGIPITAAEEDREDML